MSALSSPQRSARSGGGKSSLVNLLPRFYEPTAGTVLVDGIDVREYRLGELRTRIAVVSQNIVLRLSGAVLIPGDGYEDLFGDEEPYSILGNFIFQY